MFKIIWISIIIICIVCLSFYFGYTKGYKYGHYIGRNYAEPDPKIVEHSAMD